MTLERFMLLRIIWRDSIGFGGWCTVPELDDYISEQNTLHESVGYFWGASDDGIMIVQSVGYHEWARMGDGLKIPLEALVEVWTIS